MFGADRFGPSPSPLYLADGILSLDSLSVPVAEGGGKGAELVQLRKLRDARPPEGLIVATRHHELLVQALKLEPELIELNRALNGLVRRACQGLGVESSLWQQSEQELEYLRSGIEGLVLTGGLPEQTRRALERATLALWGESLPPLIARSSATNEDSRTASAAGQYRSVGPIWDLPGLFDAVTDVMASLYGREAIAYLLMRRIDAARRGLPDESALRVPMAVVVQRMLDSRASGMGFNVDVKYGRDGILVEAVKGQCQVQADSTVTPDAWFFDPSGQRLLERRLGAQHFELRLGRPGHGLRARRIEPEERYEPALGEVQAETIAKAVRDLAGERSAAASRIDTEFAFTDLAQHHFVQLRPQTALLPDDLDPTVSGVAEEVAARPGLLMIPSGGETASLGAAAGRLVIIAKSDARYPEGDNLPIARRYLQQGDILITPTTNIGWSPLFDRLAAVVAERGGVMSHTALIAREREIPAIVGAWETIKRITSAFGPSSQEYENGAVRIYSHATLDANNLRVFQERLPVEKQRLSRLLLPTVDEVAAARVKERVEFAHFEHDGVQYTGKPEYRMTPLQFWLYYRGWERAYEILGLPKDDPEMPLQVSIAVPDPRRQQNSFVGGLRPGDTEPRTAEEYQVVAFPTLRLAELGDRIRGQGIKGRYPDCRDVLDQILAYNEERKAAFRRFQEFMDGALSERDPFAIDYQQLFDLYAETIAFAHVRAAFRRRVAAPLRLDALEALPAEVRPVCERLLLLYARGVFMETDHVRDVEFTRLLLETCATPGLREWLCGRSWEEAQRHLPLKHPALFMDILDHAARFKVERGQSDHLENGLADALVYEKLVARLPEFRPEEAPPVFVRTAAGYAYQIERLRPFVLQADPGFDFDSFKKIMLLSWEIPALTDRERHIQHRYQYELQRILRRLTSAFHASGLLEPEKTASDLTPQQFLAAVASRRGTIQTASPVSAGLHG